jgi:hypothetical protein
LNKAVCTKDLFARDYVLVRLSARGVVIWPPLLNRLRLGAFIWAHTPPSHCGAQSVLLMLIDVVQKFIHVLCGSASVFLFGCWVYHVSGIGHVLSFACLAACLVKGPQRGGVQQQTVDNTLERLAAMPSYCDYLVTLQYIHLVCCSGHLHVGPYSSSHSLRQ